MSTEEAAGGDTNENGESIIELDDFDTEPEGANGGDTRDDADAAPPEQDQNSEDDAPGVDQGDTESGDDAIISATEDEAESSGGDLIPAKEEDVDSSKEDLLPTTEDIAGEPPSDDENETAAEFDGDDADTDDRDNIDADNNSRSQLVASAPTEKKSARALDFLSDETELSEIQTDAEQEPRSRHWLISAFYSLVILAAATTGGLSGWVLLKGEGDSPSVPSARYEYHLLPPAESTPAPSPEDTQAVTQNENLAQNNPSADAGAIQSTTDGDPSHSPGEAGPEGSAPPGEEPAAAEKSDLTDKSDNGATATPSEEELDMEAGSVTAETDKPDNSGQNEDLAFAPIRTPADVLPSDFLDKDLVSLSSQILPGLMETVGNLSVPAVSNDGLQPWQEYARKFTAPEDSPRIAIVIGGMGLNKSQTLTAIEHLPGMVSLAFSPYGHDLHELATRARGWGHETLLSIPMEPFNYPLDDPGPYGLISGLDSEQNLERLMWLMSRFPAYVGVIPEMGSLFTTSETAMQPIIDELKKRGLLFVDRRTTQRSVTGRLLRSKGLPNVTIDFVLDQTPSRAAIDAQIQRAESLARERGYAAVFSSPYPVSLERIAAWLPKLGDKGFTVAPITAVAQTSKQSKKSAKKGKK